MPEKTVLHFTRGLLSESMVATALYLICCEQMTFLPLLGILIPWCVCLGPPPS